MAVKAIIFDCFGVLVLSGRQTLQHDFPHLAAELHDLTLKSDYGYISREQHSQELADLTGLKYGEAEKRYWHKGTLNTSAFEWIDALRQTGEYKIGLLSNIGKGWLDDFLPERDRLRIFDSEVLSGEVGMAKPDERIFHLMAERLSLDPMECVMIDDLIDNIEGATRSGMQGILFGTVDDAKSDLDRILQDA